MTTFTLEHEKNYAAQCITASEYIEFEELDNLVGLPWAGYVALVPKASATPGAKWVVFPAEAQFSADVAARLNLHAKAELNADTTAKGYLGKNRRVKALRLRGVSSTALALPAEHFGNPPEGTVFDTVDGAEVCRKYVVPTKHQTQSNRQEKLWRRVDNKFLPEHYDTGQWWRENSKFKPEDVVTVTQKIHGTSVRIGRTIVKRKLNWFERLLQRLGVPVASVEYDVVGGSRKVIKDPQSATQYHFYEVDIWTHAAQRYGHLLPDGVILYGELVGYVPETDKPIQPNYTYNLAEGEYELYVYRVAVVTPDGGLYDLSWDGVVEFCNDRGLKAVPELWRGFVQDFGPEGWMDQRFKDLGFDQAVPLAAQSPVDEGVVVRRDGLTPFALKIKGPRFYEHETMLLDLEEEKDELDV